MIHAKDDPVVAYTNQDWDDCAKNEHIISLTTKRGGHVAFFQGLLPFGPTYAECVSMQYISSVLELNANLTLNLDAVSKMISLRLGESLPSVRGDSRRQSKDSLFEDGQDTESIDSLRRSFTDRFQVGDACEVSRIASTSDIMGLPAGDDPVLTAFGTASQRYRVE